MSTFKERMAKRIAKTNIERAKEDERELKFLSEMRKKEAEENKKKGIRTVSELYEAGIPLPKYKVEEKDPTYKMKRGTVMKASSDLHDDKNGKRYITTNMKIWKDLTDKDKASLKKSIMIALKHKFKGGSISDFPKDIVGAVNAIHRHFKGSGIEETGKLDEHDMNRIGSTLAPTAARKIESSVGGIKKGIMSFKDTLGQLKARAEQIKAKKAAQGKGFGTTYLKPKGLRQMVYFDSDTDSDTSSSDDDELFLPVKRGRGRPRKCQ